MGKLTKRSFIEFLYTFTVIKNHILNLSLIVFITEKMNIAYKRPNKTDFFQDDFVV